jgi:hypothetical protein
MAAGDISAGPFAGGLNRAVGKGGFKIVVMDVEAPTLTTGRITVPIPGAASILFAFAQPVTDEAGALVTYLNNVTASNTTSATSSTTSGAAAVFQVTTITDTGAGTTDVADAAAIPNIRLFAVVR